ncbi:MULTISPECIES: class I SAM-dependent methyltransferase [Bacillaceae]|uniref:class I SAM-dependent methyltransferase n=1 Tax=Bacillaceae TaxID=186817 RepID=UPI000E717B65|nr:class I SAM-dependent methyltransferase [Bacillus sp. PK3_68]RJS59086.1 SAM-dependent methyltransferase [Bacillus sp. PK3_68]
MNQTKKHLQEKFNENAPHYDEQRKKLIPCFDDFYSIPLSIIETTKEAPAVLDIGAGTGLFSSFAKERYPDAQITLIDLSEKMMDVAKERFRKDKKIDYIIADYTEYKFDQKFDIIISSLSIHHLRDVEKKKLYKKIFTWLHEDGMFLNADQVLGHTPFIESLYQNDWKHKIEASGLTKAEIQAAYERTKLDNMATLEDQISWLQESGFTDVDCLYKYFNFVVLYGRKALSQEP